MSRLPLASSVRRSVLAMCGALAAALLLLPATPKATDGLLAGTEILSRPTDHSITLRAIAAQPLTASIVWGLTDDSLEHATAPVHAGAGDPFDIVVSGLAPDTAYTYRLRLQADGQPGPGELGAPHTFHTQRLPGSPFTFVVQADPHDDENSNPAVYAQTLANELADQPDFLVDLGDAAMTDKCVITAANPCAVQRAAAYAQVAERNALMRGFFSQVGHSLPLFLVLGNHEGEAGWIENGGPNNLSVWGRRARTFFYANPVPDEFYTGNATPDPFTGLRQNYYAFEWGDALFVVIDPFSETRRKPTRYADADMWNWTLGDEQYHWLESTLESSHARYKFVFSHHMVGGSGPEARGGAAFANTFEWGGQNLDGSWGFDTRRPGWSRPIHQLFVDTGVTVWFHGHDHVYVAEQLDGIVYQEVPQPSTRRYDGPDLASQYGYQGTLGVNAFQSSGHLRVTVQPTGVQVSYVRSVAPGEETARLRNGAVVTSYEVR